jgi:membrane fusion protein, multidrug efflux system
MEISDTTRSRRKKALRAYVILAVLAVGVIAAYYLHAFWTRNKVSTDDAQIDADVVPIAARVGGVVQVMNVKDNDPVALDPATHKLPALLQIDPRDYQAKVAAAIADEKAAEATYQAAALQVQIVQSTVGGGTTSARAQVASSSAGVQAAAAQVAVAQAAVAKAQAELARAEADLARAQKLHAQGAITGRELEAAQTAHDATKAMLDGAQASLAAARGMQSSASAQVAAAQGKLAQTTPESEQIEAARKAADLAQAKWDSAKAQRAVAELQLEYATVAAPTAGTVSRLSAHAGQLVQPGQMLMMLVPTETYVIANFKETQIDRIKPGQAADVTVDALPGQSFDGVVDSLAPGTGARFSLLPPDNATGNFVKVVQRVPVKIRWKGPAQAALRAGLSAEVTIHLD